MLLHIDVTKDQPDFQAFNVAYKFEGGGALPRVAVIRADGTQIYGKGGAPESVPQLLQVGLVQAGRPITPVQAEQMQKAADMAEELIQAGKYAEAVPLVSKHLSVNSYAEAPMRIKKHADDLTKMAEEKLETAEEQLAQEATAFEGVLTLLEVQREFSRLPTVAKPVGAALVKYRKEKDLRELFAPAELLDKARLAVNTDSKRAQLYYQQVLSQYPDTKAAELAESERASLEE